MLAIYNSKIFYRSRKDDTMGIMNENNSFCQIDLSNVNTNEK